MKKVIMLMLAAVLVAGSATAQYSKELEKKAKSGDVAAMLAVGDAYAKGDGVAKDAKKAEEWYKKAEKEKCDEAYIGHAKLYTSWDGIKKDPEKYMKILDSGVKEKMPKTALERARLFEQELQEKIAAGKTEDESASTKKWMTGYCGEQVAEQIAAMYPEMCANYKFYEERLAGYYEIAAEGGIEEGLEKYLPICLSNGGITIPREYIANYEKLHGSKTPAMEKFLVMADMIQEHKAKALTADAVDYWLFRLRNARTAFADPNLPLLKQAIKKSKDNDGTRRTLCDRAGITEAAFNDNLAAMWVYALALMSDQNVPQGLAWAKRIAAISGYAPMPSMLVVSLYKMAGAQNEVILFYDDMINDDPLHVDKLCDDLEAWKFIWKKWLRDVPIPNDDVRDKEQKITPVYGGFYERIKNVEIMTDEELAGVVADAMDRASDSARIRLSYQEERVRKRLKR